MVFDTPNLTGSPCGAAGPEVFSSRIARTALLLPTSSADSLAGTAAGTDAQAPEIEKSARVNSEVFVGHGANGGPVAHEPREVGADVCGAVPVAVQGASPHDTPCVELAPPGSNAIASSASAVLTAALLSSLPLPGSRPAWRHARGEIV